MDVQMGVLHYHFTCFPYLCLLMPLYWMFFIGTDYDGSKDNLCGERQRTGDKLVFVTNLFGNSTNALSSYHDFHGLQILVEHLFLSNRPMSMIFGSFVHFPFMFIIDDVSTLCN